MSSNAAGHPGHQTATELPTPSVTNSNPGPPLAGRVLQLPAWVPPTLTKVPIGLTEKAADAPPRLPVVDSFGKANSIYKNKMVARASFGSLPSRARSTGRSPILRKDTPISPIARATDRLHRERCLPSTLMEQDTRAGLRGFPCIKFHDDSLAALVSSPTTLVLCKADESILVDRHDARNWLQKRDLFPCGVSPRPRGRSPDASQAQLDFERYGDLEGRGDVVSWRNLSPVQRRREESNLYERMILANKNSNSKVKAEGAGARSISFCGPRS